jgi:hypothetical protein
MALTSDNDTINSDSDNLSIDSDVAFAFVDFSGVDFGGKVSTGKDNDNNVVNDPSTHLQQRSVIANSKSAEIIYQNPKKLGNNNNGKQFTHDDIDMPDGQSNTNERTVHDSQLFNAQERRVENLCKWYELGIRPSLSSSSLLNLAAHDGKDDDLFDIQVDNLQTLLLRSIDAQDDMNTNLPPHPIGEYEDCLQVHTSTIEGAGNGLFASSFIPKDAIVCYYSGYRHHYQSQKRLKDGAYVLKLQNNCPKHNDGFVDALPTTNVLARYINDPIGPSGSVNEEERCNVKFSHIQQPGIWHCPVIALRDIKVGEELFISYGQGYWAESRMIGG